MDREVFERYDEWGSRVGEFEQMLVRRVAEAADALESARAEGDLEASNEASGNLIDLLAIALSHGIDVSEGLLADADAGGATVPVE